MNTRKSEANNIKHMNKTGIHNLKDIGLIKKDSQSDMTDSTQRAIAEPEMTKRQRRR